MKICLAFLLLLVSHASGAPRSKREITLSVTRSPIYNVIVSHRRLGDCTYEFSFLRADNTDPKDDLVVHYAVDDSEYKTPVVTGSTLIPAFDPSTEIRFTVPDLFVGPYDVTGVTSKSQTEGGTVEQHIVDDGGCTPGSTRGDPHMRSFDGRSYSFQGMCWYTLAKHCTENPEFEITAEFAPREKSVDSEIRTRAVRMNVTIGHEHISMDTTNAVLINERPLWAAKLSGEPKNARIVADMSSVSVHIAPYNMDILWEGRKHVFSAVISNPDYKGELCGLLGNGDGNPKNDFQKRDGSQTKVIDEFGESWKVADAKCDY